MILLNPGPVNVSDRVRQALLRPDICHREAEFSDLQTGIRDHLLKVYDLDPAKWSAILLTGSGTAAMEAMMASLMPSAGKVLVVENGVYGERLTRIAGIYRIPHRTLPHAWGEAIDPDALDKVLAGEADITHVAIVHHETTTGRLNDLASLSDVCSNHDVRLLVDGVSSFGAEELDFEDWRLDACAACANKCLHGVPGVAFVLTRRQALADIDTQRSLYLNLVTYAQQQDQGGTPFTQSVQVFYALAAALEEFYEQGGWQVRHDRYAGLAAIVREGLVALGIKPLLEATESSVVLTSYDLPENMGYGQLHDGLKQAGFIIYAGQGDFASRMFRISTMGEITVADMQKLIAATKQLLGK